MLPQLQSNGHLTTEDDMAKKQATAALSQEAAEAKISKSAALKEALRELGEDAKNSALEDWIRKKHGAEAVPANISVAKSAAKKAMAGQSQMIRRPRQAKEEATGARTPKNGSDAPGMVVLHQLVNLVGKDVAKKLIDQM
jgi:hypothetical protein